MFKEIIINTNKRMEFLDISQHIYRWLNEIKAKEGVLTVFIPHTTAGVTVNENADPSVVRDIISHTKKLVPENGDFTHSEGNSDSHIKCSLFGSSLSLIVENGKVLLGTWQGIYFTEFDGPRKRKIWLKFQGN